ncbi:MAG: MFS family permease [Candidatus Azotimanducaceae bacterium]|jgi:MFS family permease
MLPLQAMRRSLFWVSAPLFFINFALPVKSKALGATAFEIGGLFSLFTLSLLFFRPLIGVALDRFGRRLLLLLALVLYSVAYAGYGFAGNIEWMYVARLLQGLGWKFSFLIFRLLAGYAAFVAARSVPESAPVTTSQADPEPISASFIRLLILFVPLGFASALMMPIYLVYLQDMFTPDVRLLSWAFLPTGLVFAILPSRLGASVDRYGATWPCVVALLAVAVLYLVLPGFGVAEMCFGFGAVAGPLVGGYLYDPALPFYLNGVVMLSVAAILLSIVRPHLAQSR